MGKITVRKADIEKDVLVPGTVVLYGYTHCNGARSCFTRFKNATILYRLGTGGVRFKVRVEGNMKPSYKDISDLYVRI